jgi:polysaccharide pyruvyl transferase WcaK-like protein
VGDEGDRDLAAEIARAAAEAVPRCGAGAVTVSQAATLDDVMREMAGADLVVATRFHHVVSALKMARPTVSVGYAAKNRHLMARFGLGEFALGIEDVGLPQLCRAAQDVHSRRAELEPGMRRAASEVVDDLTRHVAALPLGELARSRS